ncbi:hypothetical protein F5884DRAFT_755366 [Xylogone sp. PMI_703]|nr:hypothetical protein F5884DRAFT_755366 [Xylogone sp. PMI_703]
MYNLITPVHPDSYEVDSPLTTAPPSDNGIPYVLYSNGSTSSFEYIDPLTTASHMPEGHFVDYTSPFPQQLDATWHGSSFSSADSGVYTPEPAAPEGFEVKIQHDYKELFNCVERVTVNNSGQGNSLLRRREKNRVSQRAFRARKEKYTRDLEKQYRDLREKYDRLMQIIVPLSNTKLYGEINLQELLLEEENFPDNASSQGSSPCESSKSA